MSRTAADRQVRRQILPLHRRTEVRPQTDFPSVQCSATSFDYLDRRIVTPTTGSSRSRLDPRSRSFRAPSDQGNNQLEQPFTDCGRTCSIDSVQRPRASRQALRHHHTVRFLLGQLLHYLDRHDM